MNTTTKYNMFTVPPNRQIHERHVSCLMKANRKNNLLDCYPIIVNEKLELFDGQHRLECAKRLGIPISFIVKEGIRIDHDTLLEINSHTKTHSLQDKIDIAVSYGDPEILKVKELWNLEPRIGQTAVCELLQGWTTGSQARKSLSTRTYRVKYVELYKDFLVYFSTFNFYDEAKFKKHFVHSLAWFYKTHPEHIETLKEKSESIKICTTRAAYRTEFLRNIS